MVIEKYADAIEWNKVSERSFHIRQNIIRTADYCKGKVHWGSSLSCVEILNVLYGLVLNLSEKNTYQDRDKIIVSKGQAALSVYLAMQENGLLSDDVLGKYQKNGTVYSEELTMCEALDIPCSTGSLGLGLPFGVGLALAAKRKGYAYRVYVVCGDGECDEGSVWEAALAAAHYQLDNLVLVVDHNHLQADGAVKDIMDLNSLQKKFEAFGWNSRQVNGHCEKELFEALTQEEKGKPHAVIAETVKGKGISFMENEFMWHDHVLDGALQEQAKREVGIVDDGA